MFDMAKRKRIGRNVNVYIDTRIGKVLDKYVEDALPRTTVTAVIEKALLNLFQSEGKWSSPSRK